MKLIVDSIIVLAVTPSMLCAATATVDLGSINFSSPEHLENTTGDSNEADYLFIDFVNGSSALVESVSGNITPLSGNAFFGDSNPAPLGSLITSIDFILTTAASASAGTNQPFSVFLQSGSNTFESSLFTNGLQPDQVYSFSNVPVSLQNNEGSEDLYFAIKYNGSDRLSLTDASLSVTYTAVPEPTSSALAALASLGLLARRRRTV